MGTDFGWCRPRRAMRCSVVRPLAMRVSVTMPDERERSGVCIRVHLNAEYRERGGS